MLKSKTETLGIKQAISDGKSDIELLSNKINNLNDIDRSLQYPVDRNLLDKYKAKLTKRLHFYQSHSHTRWKDWPFMCENRESNGSSLNPKIVKNRNKKDKYQMNKMKRIADQVKADGTVINLTNIELPVGSVAVLSYGDGFVPKQSEFNSFRFRADTISTMNKVNNLACRLENPPKDPDIVEDDHGYIIPPKLQRTDITPRVGIPKDRTVNDVYKEVLNFSDNFKPKKKGGHNLNKIELEGLKWLRQKTKNGEIVICKADKGGA